MVSLVLGLSQGYAGLVPSAITAAGIAVVADGFGSSAIPPASPA